jgi:hypothetical protein
MVAFFEKKAYNVDCYNSPWQMKQIALVNVLTIFLEEEPDYEKKIYGNCGIGRGGSHEPDSMYAVTERGSGDTGRCGDSSAGQ